MKRYRLSENSRFVDVGTGSGIAMLHVSHVIGCTVNGAECDPVKSDTAMKIVAAAHREIPELVDACLRATTRNGNGCTLKVTSDATHVFTSNKEFTLEDNKKLTDTLNNGNYLVLAWCMDPMETEMLGLDGARFFDHGTIFTATSSYPLYFYARLYKNGIPLHGTKITSELEARTGMATMEGGMEHMIQLVCRQEEINECKKLLGLLIITALTGDVNISELQELYKKNGGKINSLSTFKEVLKVIKLYCGESVRCVVGNLYHFAPIDQTKIPPFLLK